MKILFCLVRFSIWDKYQKSQHESISMLRIEKRINVKVDWDHDEDEETDDDDDDDSKEKEIFSFFLTRETR